MKQLIIVMGAPGSGKSTYGKLLKNYKVFDIDDYGYRETFTDAPKYDKVALIYPFDLDVMLDNVMVFFPDYRKYLVMLDDDEYFLHKRQIIRGRYITIEETRKYRERCKGVYDRYKGHFRSNHVISSGKISRRPDEKVEGI